MFLSKIWFVLVGLLAGVATTAAFVAPRSADRRIIELEGQRLDRAQYAAEQMLKADAHSWIDYAAKLSRDAVLAESLDSASKGQGEARLLTETVRGRLKTLVTDLNAIGLDAIGAVDAKGRVIGRIGDKENEAGDNLGGIEVMADALRGYLSDDVWGSGEKLQRVAAVPVLSKGRDRIVGAIWVAAEGGKRLAEVWKKNLGVEIAILLRGQVRTSTVPEPFVSGLPALIEERSGEIAEAKRTRPIPVTVGEDRLLAVAAPFVGQAGAQGAFFVLIGKMSAASDPLALLSTTTADDLRWGNFPWLGLGLGLAVILGVGLFLQRIEAEKPLAQLRTEVQRLARGEVQKLNDHAYPGKFGGIARDVNAALEKYTLAAPPKSETARKDLDAILGPAPTPAASTAPASVFDLPQSHFGMASSAPPAFPGNAAPPPRPASSPVPSFVPPSPFGGGTPTPTVPPLPFSSGAVTPPPMPIGINRPSRPGGGGASAAVMAALDPDGPTSVIPGASPSLLAATAPSAQFETVEGSEEAATSRHDAGSIEEAEYDEHVQGVYEEYLATRERCGESVGSLTLERFRAKLDANRSQLIAKYSCRSARFSVYVKDGKAAIKASPVR